MKGTKFQVGDQVRVRDCSYARVYNEVGQLSTIVGYRNRLYYVVGLHLYYAGELEAVNSKGEVKDEVRAGNQGTNQEH